MADSDERIGQSDKHALHTCLGSSSKMTPSSDTMKHEIIRKKFSPPSNFHDAKALKLNKLKVRTEGSAMVLASIILLFLIAHSFRLAFKIYEINLANNALTIEKFKICFALKR